jgi:hypothetical protein
MKTELFRLVFFYFGTVPTVWYIYILELFQQCGIFIFWNCSDSMVYLYFGTVPFQNINIPHCRNSSKIKKYQSEQFQNKKNTTLSEQFQNKKIPVGTVPK